MLDILGNDKLMRGRESVPAITPCDNCRHAQRCKSQALACQAFVLFKRCSPSPQRWSQAPRLPSSDLYDRAMQPVIKKPAVRSCPVEEEDSDLELEFGLELDVTFDDWER